MFRWFVAMGLAAVALATLCGALHAQQIESGPKLEATMPGPFLTLNLSGDFVGRYHCLICENRLAPVAMVMVRAQSEAIDPEVKKLLEALDTAVGDRFGQTGVRSFVVFLSPRASSGVTAAKPGDPTAIITEAANREKLVNNLKEQAKAFKRVIFTTCPIESVPPEYKLADKAEVTVTLYAAHRALANFSFAEGQLNQNGTDAVIKGLNDTLDRLQKAPGAVK
jgi:hypothetical protein